MVDQAEVLAPLHLLLAVEAQLVSVSPVKAIMVVEPIKWVTSHLEVVEVQALLVLVLRQMVEQYQEMVDQA
jgi:hypothetical protein